MRIIDKDTRLIDVDFGQVAMAVQRLPGSLFPDNTPGNQATYSGLGEGQLLVTQPDTRYAGSFVQFERIDLDYMARNGEVMQPVEVSVQRTSATPFGTHQNGNNFTSLKEYLFVLTRPLALTQGQTGSVGMFGTQFNLIGLHRGSTAFGGQDGVKFEQNIYAECREYVFTNTQGATITNGELQQASSQVPPGTLSSFFSQPTLVDVNTWGSLSSITGPNLYCYRVISFAGQGFEADGTIFKNVDFGGFTTFTFPPVSIGFLCKDPKLTEGQYLSRVANAMTHTGIGEPVVD